MVRDIETTWSITLPDGFAQLENGLDWNALHLPDGSVFKVSLPLLTEKQIVDAFELREDWDLPEGFVPFLGDFHDLIGLDYSAEPPAVIALDDTRLSRPLFDNFQAFLASRFLEEEEAADPSGIIEGKSWLDI